MIPIFDHVYPQDECGEWLANIFLTLFIVEYRTLLAACSRSIARAAKLLWMRLRTSSIPL
jgi:hypothetical protein